MGTTPDHVSSRPQVAPAAPVITAAAPVPASPVPLAPGGEHADQGQDLTHPATVGSPASVLGRLATLGAPHAAPNLPNPAARVPQNLGLSNLRRSLSMSSDELSPDLEGPKEAKAGDRALVRLAGSTSGSTSGRGAQAHHHNPGCGHLQRATATSVPSWLRPKLEVGRSNDPAEVEADRIADAVVATLHGGARVQEPVAPSSVSRSFDGGAAAVGEAGGEISSDLQSDIMSARSGGAPLPGPVRQSMEEAMGTDLSQVRMHAGPKSDELNEKISAKAFTVGSDIFFKGGLPSTATTAGTHLLAHELAHVAQQSDATPIRRVMEKEFKEDPEGFMQKNVVRFLPFEGFQIQYPKTFASMKGNVTQSLPGQIMTLMSQHGGAMEFYLAPAPEKAVNEETKEEMPILYITPAIDRLERAKIRTLLVDVNGKVLFGAVDTLIASITRESQEYKEPIKSDGPARQETVRAAYFQYKSGLPGLSKSEVANNGAAGAAPRAPWEGVGNKARLDDSVEFAFTEAMNGCAMGITVDEKPGFMATHFQSETDNALLASKFRQDHDVRDWFGVDEYWEEDSKENLAATNIVWNPRDKPTKVISQTNVVPVGQTLGTTFVKSSSRELNVTKPLSEERLKAAQAPGLKKVKQPSDLILQCKLLLVHVVAEFGAESESLVSRTLQAPEIAKLASQAAGLSAAQLMLGGGNYLGLRILPSQAKIDGVGLVFKRIITTLQKLTLDQLEQAQGCFADHESKDWVLEEEEVASSLQEVKVFADVFDLKKTSLAIKAFNDAMRERRMSEMLSKNFKAEEDKLRAAQTPAVLP